VQKAQKAEEPKHIQWADTIVEEEEEEEADDSDSDSDFDDEDFQMLSQIRTIRRAPVQVSSEELDDEEEDEEYYDEEEDEPELALVRTQSHSANPPELVDDSDSEDDTPPASPPQANFDLDLFDEKQAASISEALIDDTYYIRERNAPMIAAY
jgi:hypothetical protein